MGREAALEWGLELKCCRKGTRRGESYKLAVILKFKKRSGNILMPNYVTPFIPVFLLSLVFHLIDWNFSYLCYQLKLGWPKAFLFCSILAWQTPAYAAAYTFNNISITASVLKKTNPDFLASTRPERTCCSFGMWQEAIYKELTLTVTLYSWFSKI